MFLMYLLSFDMFLSGMHSRLGNVSECKIVSTLSLGVR